jgi:hypothetical protein
MSGMVATSGTAMTGATMVRVPRQRRLATRPVSSSPGRTSESPESQAGSTSVVADRWSDSRSVDSQGAVV